MLFLQNRWYWNIYKYQRGSLQLEENVDSEKFLDHCNKYQKEGIQDTEKGLDKNMEDKILV